MLSFLESVRICKLPILYKEVLMYFVNIKHVDVFSSL